MPGGLIQLAAYGAENKYLMGNPEITFFKLVYKQHTNFSIESVEIAFEGLNNVSQMSSNPTALKIKVPRVADLVNQVFVKVKLPNIISSINRKFKWVENLGEVMVQSASLYIGGSKVETITSEWLHLYHKLNLSGDKRKMYEYLIGHSPDLHSVDDKKAELIDILNNYCSEHGVSMDNIGDIVTSFTDQILCNNFIKNDKKATSLVGELGDLYGNNPYYDPQNYSNKSGLTPSIVGRDLYIPIPFYFTKNIGLSLPLIALQYHDVEIQIEFAPIMYLYTIIEFDVCSKRTLRRRPNPLKNNHALSYYTYVNKVVHDIDECQYNQNISEVSGEEAKMSNKDIYQLENRIQNMYNNNNFIFEISLELFYIFLDEKERNIFAEANHEYLIEQVGVRCNGGYHGDLSQFDMSVYNPVKEVVWVLGRSDLNNYNIWFNYSNFINPDKPHYRQNCNEYEASEKICQLTHKNWESFRENILINAKFMYNGIDRFDTKSSNYFDFLQPYIYHSSGQKGINVYSFSVEPEKFQPSGAVNMSMISKFSIEFNTIKPPMDPEIDKILCNQNIKDEDKAELINKLGLRFDKKTRTLSDKQVYKYTFDLRVYIVNYNILKIASGMGGLAYTS